jgi:hypothetical protein
MVPTYTKTEQEEDEKQERNVPTGTKMQQRTEKGTGLVFCH